MPVMADLLGFWSYVHKDDEIDLGRVAQLARDLVGHCEAIRAEEIRLSSTTTKFTGGDDWKERVDDALSNVAFFVPVVTPHYFKSRMQTRIAILRIEDRKTWYWPTSHADPLHRRARVARR